MKLLNFYKIIPALLLLSVVPVIFFAPLPPLLDQTSFSTAIYDENHQLLRLTLNKEEKYRLYTPFSELSEQLIAASLLQEDQYFYHHFGVNPVAMVNATFHTYILHSRRIGASTITMQLARMRFGINSKTIQGKLEQILRAVQLEMHHSKQEILEAYLNLAPYGGNIEGAGAASLIYFHKPLKSLTLPEVLTLSIIPQNPNQRTPANRQLKEIRNKLYLRWVKKHPEDEDKAALMELPVDMKTLHQLPFHAPHFVQEILKNSAPAEAIESTLNLRLQKVVERVVHHYLQRKNYLGVHNAAVLLVDSRDMSIKVMMGSADFFNDNISGQINGTEIKRSPGSTLKPFIYALALDQGLIHPATVLKDVPHSFHGYNPENFDYDFMGPVKAKDALILSRNIPAIFLASRLTKPSLYQLLFDAGVSQLKSESFYGLSLAMGGAEISSRELATLYAMLGNDGVLRSLRALKKEPMSPGRRLLSMESAYLIQDILKKTPPPAGQDFPKKLPPSWKTGTSSGYRDAWTAGLFGPYVMTVWIGNFDNTGNPAFIGKEVAAPLFFELMRAIIQETKITAEAEKSPAGLNLVQIEVCKASGMLPSRYCSETEKTWFIPGKSPIDMDTIFREVAVNIKTGLRSCHIDENTRFEIYEFWPSDLLKIFRQAGLQRRQPPFFEEGCQSNISSHTKPQITSPETDLSYIMRANSHNNPIPFSAVTDAGVKYIYWFVNDTFLAKISADKTFFWSPHPGRFIIRAVDDQGLADARDISVLMKE